MDNIIHDILVININYLSLPYHVINLELRVVISVKEIFWY